MEATARLRTPVSSSSPAARSTRRSCSSRSGVDNPNVGRHLGLHPVRLVYGLFDEPQDAHMVYPITAHCMEFQRDEEGGFVIEATTIQDPISFATTLRDEQGPFWGPRLVAAVRGFRNWIGLLALVNDENGSAVVVDEAGGERFDVDFEPVETERMDASLDFSRRVLEAAGAKQICWTGSRRRTSRAAAAWATTRRGRWSTATASRTRSSGSSSATRHSSRARCP